MALGHIHITDELVQAVRDAADVVEVASEHTRLRKAGREMAGLCPLHKEKTPSFSVDPVKGIFYCFGCGRGGDAIKLHMLLTGDEFPEAIESLAQRYGIPLPTAKGTPVDRRRESVLAAAEEWFRERLAASAFARDYLEERGMPAALVAEHRLGYAPDGWQNLLDALGSRFPVDLLGKAGLVGVSDQGGRRYDRFRNRLIFPIRNASGRLVGFGGRTLGDDRAKYVNTAETESFHKSRLLYGLDLARRAIRESSRALLVEGYFDVLGARAAGIEGVVASMGTALTEEQVDLLSRYADEVLVGYDADPAGERAAHRALPILLAKGLGVRRVRFGQGHDPDSLRLEAGDEAVRRAVEEARDLVEEEMERHVPEGVQQDPRDRARSARAVVELLAAVPDTVLRYGYGQRAAARLGVPVHMLLDRLGLGRRQAAASEPEPPADDTGHRQEGEEKLIVMLLAQESLPPREELPPEEAFLDPACRNIYRTFCALYGGEGGPSPSAADILSSLADEAGEVDRAAKVLMTEAEAGSGEIEHYLFRLRRRWLEQRLRRLGEAIEVAERAGDGARVEALLEERQALNRERHRVGGGGS